MKIKNKVETFEPVLSNWFKKILDMPQPLRSDGIIYKRFPQNKKGKFTEEEMDYLIANQIPF